MYFFIYLFLYWLYIQHYTFITIVVLYHYLLYHVITIRMIDYNNC